MVITDIQSQKKKGRYKNMTKKEVLEKLQARKARSAWQRGVKDYAIDLLDNIEGDEMPPLTEIKKALLNGTQDWHQYKYRPYRHQHKTYHRQRTNLYQSSHHHEMSQIYQPPKFHE